MCWDGNLRDDEARHRFWNTAPGDPLKAAANSGAAHFNKVLGRTLMPDSFFPLGNLHREKTMRNVPAAYYRWLQSQAWFRTSREWAPVRDYMERFPAKE